MRITLLLTFFICTCMMGQDLKKKKKSGMTFHEVFTVDKNTKERQGYYYKIFKHSKDTLVKGFYQQGEKAGVWSYMGEKNILFLKYDYDQKKLLNNTDNGAEHHIQVKKGSAFTLQQVDKPVIFLGYKNELKDILTENIKPSPTFFENIKSGTVMSSLEINKMGEAENFKIESSYTESINGAIEKAFDRIKMGWIPATVNNEPVISKMYIMFNFSHDTYTDINNIPKTQPKSMFEDKDDMFVVDVRFIGVVRER